MITPWRATILGYRYHTLHQAWQQAVNENIRLEGSIDKLTELAERRFRACCSLEKQKAKLQLEIERLKDTHDHHSWERCDREIKALKAENADLKSGRYYL